MFYKRHIQDREKQLKRFVVCNRQLLNQKDGFSTKASSTHLTMRDVKKNSI
jgi:hypothetical protein